MSVDVNGGGVSVFRHLESYQNALRHAKDQSTLYVRFDDAFRSDPFGTETRTLAAAVEEEFPLPMPNDEIPLTDGQFERGVAIGRTLSRRHGDGDLSLPDKVVTSGVVRTRATAAAITEGFPALAERIADTPTTLAHDRLVKERCTGDAELYSDTQVYLALNPEILRQKLEAGPLGRFTFSYPNGESVQDTMVRGSLWDASRDESVHTWLFTHMVFLYTYRLRHENLPTSVEEQARRYISFYDEPSPPNGSMTTYVQSAGGLLLRNLHEELA